MACSYVSLNFNFVNSGLSLRILQALVTILFRLLSMPQEDKSPKSTNSLGKNF